MKKFVPTLIVFVLLSGFCKGQEFCVTMEHLELLKQNDPTIELNMQVFEEQLQQFLNDPGSQLKSSNGIVTIPLVYHIIYNTPEENLPDSRIYEQIAVLNEDYRGRTIHGSIVPFNSTLKIDCEIEFCLAQRDPLGKFTSGIERRETTVNEFSADNSMKHLSTGGMDAWDTKKYMNIWVCDMEGLLNYAQFPGSAVNNTYGVVNDYMCVGLTGAYPNYDLGAVTTHELGHCFSLYHIWGDDGTACTGTDYCNDTPNQAGYVLDPPYIGCTMTDACTPNTPGIMYMNFMDYSRDRFKTNFTPNQKTRIQALFNPKRGALYSLTISDGCLPATVICNAPMNLFEDFTGETSVTLNWDAVSSAVSYSVQYMIEGASNWITVSTSNNYLSLQGLTPATDYIWRVQTLCSGGVSSAYSTILSFPTGGVATCIFDFEPNETRTTAAQIATGVPVQAGIPAAADLDWYKFSNSVKQKNIKVLLYDMPADYDLKLFNSTGVQIGVSQNTGTTIEKIVYNNGSKGTYYIEVYSAAGAFSENLCYTLEASISSTTYATMYEGTVDNERNTPLLFQVYPNPANNILNVDYNAATWGILEARIYDLIGTSIGYEKHSFVKGLNSYQLDISNIQKGMYILYLTDGIEKKAVKIFVE